MTRVSLPPEVVQQVKEWEFRQRYHPMETERVEGNLRMTKTRRPLPTTAHYNWQQNGRHDPTR